jgi:prepilin-type N-terminal cleavage/methylation domain-containing protein
MRKAGNMIRGFTLIELLIVLAVIASLLAIVTPIALNAVAQAKATQVASNFRSLKSAVESYVNIERPATPSSISLNELVNRGYLSAVPDNFTLSMTNWSTGVATVTIFYNSLDVDPNKLRGIYPDVTVSSTNITLRFRIAKWW